MRDNAMTSRERFQAAMGFQPFDRLPIVEWAPWWHLTIERWRREGLPESLQGLEINRYLGMDISVCDYIHGLTAVPKAIADKVGEVSDADDYARAREYLYPWPAIDLHYWQAQAALQARGEITCWCEFGGCFFFPRDLLGIERHLYAFYDHPQLMHWIIADLAEYHVKLIDDICAVCRPDIVCFGEDMSYNHGPMISKEMFDGFMRPYYERVIPRLKEYGVLSFVDCDGDVTVSAGWFQEVGVEGMVPLERQAGVDVVGLRASFPEMRFIGCFDKMTMSRGEAAMRAEFERLLPVARGGGLVIGCDHQTPPGVSYQDYQLYLRLFGEYAAKAGRGE